MDQEIAVRVTVINPVPGVNYAMQRGKSELLPPAKATKKSLVFELSVRVAQRESSKSANVLGPYAHGTPNDRFLYVNSGTMAGQLDSTWTRRAKIKTAGITWQLVEEVLADRAAGVEVSIDGRAKDDGPCCASIPLLDGGWKMINNGSASRRANK